MPSPQLTSGGGAAPADRPPRHMPMTAWYNPILLVKTGIRVLVSTVFEQLGDRRELIAAAYPIPAEPFDACFDYSRKADEKGDFWFDFVADTGDGWDSTLAVARLVTKPSLTVAKHQLPRGRLLLFGGDEVYPTPSRQDYEDRLVGPLDEALRQVGAGADESMPDLYALPGNHDWYDGLNAFMTLFCRRRIAPDGLAGVSRDGRKIAGRRTFQTRTYFALKLPRGWWLWGTDSQIQGYLDQSQVDYFQYAASHWMEPGSKVILCSGQPSWAYADARQPELKFTTFSYLERLPGLAKSPEGKPMGHELKLVMTGDSHHYSRYSEDGLLQYLTAGGGGAFLHPTHHLKDPIFKWRYPAPGKDAGDGDHSVDRHFVVQKKEGDSGKAVFPDQATSRALTARNLGFAFLNPGMLLIYWAWYAIFYWSVEASALDSSGTTLGHLPALSSTFGTALLEQLGVGFATPWPFLLFLASLLIYGYFADEPYDAVRRWTIGVLHGLAHAAAVVGMGCASFWLFAKMGSKSVWLSDVAPIVAGSFAAAFVSATLFGCYLWFCLNVLEIHWDEAFSSLRIKDYKNFLRLRIAGDGTLNVYPIGLTRVPRGSSIAGLHAHLIEGPIVVPAARAQPSDTIAQT